MVRLKDIAQRAGVSVMTVSKALRDVRDVAPDTRARIKTLAAQMGYVPDAMAQSLRSRFTKLFGLIISASTNPIFARVVMGLEERAHELGYQLMLAHSLNQPEREEMCIRRMLSRRVEGLFISPVYRLEPKADIYVELQARRFPTVLLGHAAPFCRDFVSIETEDVFASQQLTRHLLELGHRRIAFFGGPSVAPWAQERFEGYRRALREAGIEVDEKLVFNAGATIEEGAAVAAQFAGERTGATAIQAVNDLVAIGAADTLLNQRVRIPEDLSLVGFGNILVTEYFRVPLTTIRQPKLRLGTAAMDAMLKLLRGERPETRRLPAELIIRQSTAPPPAKLA
ncbi:MAG TPA: LacI family DNA-binding transcriptional regulator [Verrucomicrobiae bacterium]